MGEFLHYIYQTARREFRLVGALKIVGLAFLPTIWTQIAFYFNLKNQTLSTPTLWLSTALCLSLGFLFVITKRAHSLENPEFDLDLHVSSPVDVTDSDAQFRYVNVAVTNKSGKNLENCSAFLKDCKKNQESTNFEKQVGLMWNIPKQSFKTEIVVGGELVVHVVRSGDKGHGLRFVDESWNRLKNQFNDPAIYKFIVLVNAGGLSKSITFEIDWKGVWNNFTTKEIEVRNVTG